MASGLPPPPVNDKPGSFAWLEWYRQLRNYVSTSGSVPWYIINFSGSNITDIAIRLHDNLQGIQGGTAGEHYHLTNAEKTGLTTATNTSLHYHTIDRDRANHTGTQQLSTISDVTITATNLNTLDDGISTTLHYHSSDRDRTNHTGTQSYTTITGLGPLATASAGYSGTVSLAKLTTGGTNGTITVVNGIITAVTQPT